MTEIVWPRGEETLVMVQAVPDETARCECGGPLFTPHTSRDFEGSLTVDWVRCARCHAHCVVTITPPNSPAC